jgi:hypothetical protein
LGDLERIGMSGEGELGHLLVLTLDRLGWMVVEQAAFAGGVLLIAETRDVYRYRVEVVRDTYAEAAGELFQRCLRARPPAAA